MRSTTTTSRLFGAMLAVISMGLATVGCSDRSSSGRGELHVVSQVTGDPDDEVSQQLQAQVQAALARGENDDPIDF